MFGTVGLALGAISTVSSLLEAAATGIEQAAGNAPVQASGGGQVFRAPAAQSIAHARPSEPGVVLPKFDERTQAALLALQEQHRGA